MSRANIFVVGMDKENLETLGDIPYAEDYRFHPLLSIEELQQGEVVVPELISKAQAKLDAFDGSIDAIVGYWDFPVSTIVPVLCERYGLRSNSLEAVAKCEHKYWSRLEQQKATDAHPAFALVDLSGTPQPPANVGFPMWLKPSISYSSELAFGVKDEREFQEAVTQIREGIGRVGRPFEYILDRLDLPPEVSAAGGEACLAEEALTGRQVAVEGYAYNGEVTVYGALDSVNHPDSSSFLRHQYPSALPGPVVARLRDISQRVMRQIGTDSATFSIEFFYDPETDVIKLLEINPRHSQSHAELFQFVDGVPNHHCMVSLALGRNPELPDKQGPYEVAAKWYHRRFEDGRVRRVPTDEEVHRIEQEIPGVRIRIVPEEGQRLSDLPEQDSYSFELAQILIGGENEKNMRDKFDRCVAALRFVCD